MTREEKDGPDKKPPSKPRFPPNRIISENGKERDCDCKNCQPDSAKAAAEYVKDWLDATEDFCPNLFEQGMVLDAVLYAIERDRARIIERLSQVINVSKPRHKVADWVIGIVKGEVE